MTRLARFSAAILFVAVSVATAGARPAAAGEGLCGGEVLLVSSQAVTYPVLGPVSQAVFTFSSTALTLCSGGHVLSGSIVLGCGNATGSGGTLAGHHSYSYSSNGAVLFTGDVSGVLLLVPDVGQSCFTGVTRFRAYGALVLV